MNIARKDDIMAEFCKECFKNMITMSSDNIKDKDIVMSKDLDLCEGCATMKQVVIRVKKIK